VKVREVIARVERDGWKQLPATATNHRQYKHDTKPGRVTISGNPGREVPPVTLRSILKQAGITYS